VCILQWPWPVVCLITKGQTLHKFSKFAQIVSVTEAKLFKSPDSAQIVSVTEAKLSLTHHSMYQIVPLRCSYVCLVALLPSIPLDQEAHESSFLSNGDTGYKQN